MANTRSRRGRIMGWAIVLVISVAALMAFAADRYARDSAAPDPSTPVKQATADIGRRVHEFCGACHEYPPADTFPRDAWQHEVEQGYRFFSQAGKNLEAPPMDEVVAYYEARAPEKLVPAQFQNATTPPPVAFERIPVPALPDKNPPAIANV